MKKMKVLLGVSLWFVASGLFGQEECKCYENTYKVPGEIVYTTKGEGNAKEDHYAGMIDGKVQFSILKYNNEGVIEQINVSTFPIADICMTMNDEWSSKSKTEDKTDPAGNYVLLTFGGTLMGGKDSGISIMDRCIKRGDTSPNFFKNVMRTGTIYGKFTDGKAVLAFYDKVKAVKEGK